jgi:hypothetical protein
MVGRFGVYISQQENITKKWGRIHHLTLQNFFQRLRDGAIIPWFLATAKQNSNSQSWG